MDACLSAAEVLKPKVVVLDSVQTLYSLSIDSVPGRCHKFEKLQTARCNFPKEREFYFLLVMLPWQRATGSKGLGAFGRYRYLF